MSSESELEDEMSEVPKEQRKSKRSPDNRVKTKKLARNSKEAHLGPRILCDHRNKNYFCQADQLSQEDMTGFYNKLYNRKDAASQTAFLTPYIIPFTPARERKCNENGRDRVQMQYHVCKCDLSLVLVCVKTFLGITALGRKHTFLKMEHNALSSEVVNDKARSNVIYSQNVFTMEKKTAAFSSVFL